MRRPLKIALAIGGGVLVLGLGWGLYLMILAGEFRSIDYHAHGTCERIEGVVGPEDMVFLAVPGEPEGGVLISSDDRRATVRGEEVRGAIRYLSLGPDAPPPRDVTGEAPELFHPHGIDLTPPDAAARRLFVVNHPGDSLFGASEDGGEGPAHTIEIFDVRTDAGGVRLAHLRTIADPLLVSPNDVAAVDAERFYVTNDHGATGSFRRKLEDYGHLARGHVLYWDGDGFARVADGIHYANGIALSPDRATVYVAAITGRQILAYDRDPETGALTRREAIPVRGPDNITIAEDGSLWIGSHPKLLTFQGYAKHPDELSPSQVFHVTAGADGWTVEDVFASDGSDISGSSVGLMRDGRLLIGSVFDPWLLSCRP